MSDTQTLTPENDYQFEPAPSQAKLTKALWNMVMMSISTRVRAIEVKGDALQDIIDELKVFGLERLDEAINPLITDVQEQIAALQQAVQQTIEQNATIIAQFQEDTEAAFVALNQLITTRFAEIDAQILLVEQRINDILAGGFPANDVTESSTRVFVSPAQKAEIGQLRTDLTNTTTSLTDALEDMETALNAAIDALEAGTERVVTANTTAVAGERIRAKTAGGPVTVSLPSNAGPGHRVTVLRDGPNPVIIDRNTKTITGLNDNMQMSTNKTVAQMTYSDGTWTVQKGTWA